MWNRPACSTLQVGLLLTALGGVARADLVVSLEPRDTSGNLITGPVETGSQVFVDISLSVDAADGPVTDLTLFEFDFLGTSDTLSLESFSWRTDVSAYPFQVMTFPFPGAFSPCGPTGGDCLALSADPLLVATVQVTVNGSGRFDAVSGLNGVSQSVFDAAVPLVRYSVTLGNLRGGSLDLTVLGTPPVTEPPPATNTPPPADTPTPADAPPGSGGSPSIDAAPTADPDGDGLINIFDPDDDNDGTNDTADVFPNDPSETSDLDGDGVGDNADAFPLDATETVDTDLDGIGDAADPDDDNDGVLDVNDPAPLDPTIPAAPSTPDSTDQAPPPTSGAVPSPCGIAMVNTSFLILLGLGGLGLVNRRRFR